MRAGMASWCSGEWRKGARLSMDRVMTWSMLPVGRWADQEPSIAGRLRVQIPSRPAIEGLFASEARPQPYVIATPNSVVILNRRPPVIVDARLRTNRFRPGVQQVVHTTTQVDRGRNGPAPEQIDLIVRRRTLQHSRAARRGRDRGQVLPAQ